MRHIFFLHLAMALILFLSGPAMGFTVTIYTDRAEWENAVSGQFLIEDFNDAELNDGVSFISSESGHINLTFGYYQDVLMALSSNEPVTTWYFTPQISAYGGTWTLGGPGGYGNYIKVYLDDMEEPVGYITNNYNGDFWGIISDAPFTSVTLLGGSTNHQQSYKLDDMVYCPEGE